MKTLARIALAAAGWFVAAVAPARAESLEDAWAIALRLNAGLQSRQLDSVSAGLSLGAARALRLPSVRTYDINSLLSHSPYVRFAPNASGSTGNPFPGVGTGGTGATGVPTSPVPLVGPNQTDIPFLLGTISQPIYAGGRIRKGIDAAGFQLNAQKTEEARATLDLRLTVAEAYVGVLRARRDLEVTLSDVARLDSFLRDVTNRKNEQLATRNEQLAADVSLANARLREITARKNLDAAWATYNRYLCRPPTTVVELEELASAPAEGGLEDLAARALKARPEFFGMDESEAVELAGRAVQTRPELAGLGERAKASDAQADATLAGIRPQLTANATYIDPGNRNLTNPNFFVGSFTLSWTLFDGGNTRKRAEALRVQGRSYMKQRADLAADIALQVRTRWLDVNEARQRVIIAGATIASAEENIGVVTDRYRQGLSNYTEVLDAETRRVQSFTSYFDAVYDQALATFRLKRAVGDL